MFFIASVVFKVLVDLGGLEPPTSRLSGVRSNRLSYEPISSARIGDAPFALYATRLFCTTFIVLVEMRRIELLTPCVQGRCSPS